MGIFDGCVLACDIDGTLMESGYINPINIEKINYFEKEGGKFVISTGRGVAALTPVLEKMPDISLAVVANGCIIYNYKTKQILFERKISRDEYQYAELVSNLDLNVGTEVHCGAEAYTLRRNKNADIHQEYEKFYAPDVSFEQLKDKAWNKVIFLFSTAGERQKAKEILEKENTECLFIDTAAVIDGKLQNYLEQVPRGISKAAALNELCEILKVKNGNMFAIGDYFNDVEMLKTAAVSAVPCNSPSEVKQYADYVTCSCKDGAVADFIDYLKNYTMKG